MNVPKIQNSNISFNAKVFAIGHTEDLPENFLDECNEIAKPIGSENDIFVFQIREPKIEKKGIMAGGEMYNWSTESRDIDVFTSFKNPYFPPHSVISYENIEVNEEEDKKSNPLTMKIEEFLRFCASFENRMRSR